jgi:hypothetical protein
MQRRFDVRARQPRGGNINELLTPSVFKPYDCAAMSLAACVCWQVKQAVNAIVRMRCAVAMCCDAVPIALYVTWLPCIV